MQTHSTGRKPDFSGGSIFPAAQTSASDHWSQCWRPGNLLPVATRSPRYNYNNNKPLLIIEWKPWKAVNSTDDGGVIRQLSIGKIWTANMVLSPLLISFYNWSVTVLLSKVLFCNVHTYVGYRQLAETEKKTHPVPHAASNTVRQLLLLKMPSSQSS